MRQRDAGKPLHATLARRALLRLDSMAAPDPHSLGVPRPQFPRLCPACLPRYPLQTILRQVLATGFEAHVTSVSHPDYDRLLMGSPLRRRAVCIVLCVALLAALSLATLIHLGLLASMRPDVAGVFCRALALSSALAAAPLAVLWFLDRRERETPWLFAAAFLWGGFIATALALPFNTVFFALVDLWVAQHPIASVVLGPDAAAMLAAPISAPIAEEIAKALGVLLIFWLLRAEFDNMRDGIV